ncbi:unnamed protein product [Litomosoides sigmodontis]|uniref:Uncharacterized protein n=1 Tax=Litomosoides sigmodontis TaxID=42156 RepID=A0A3P6UG59_LITSI|nr:unnamed protein product [Litomosoides sigmodontis]
MMKTRREYLQVHFIEDSRTVNGARQNSARHEYKNIVLQALKCAISNFLEKEYLEFRWQKKGVSNFWLF